MQEDALRQLNWWGLQAMAWRAWHLTARLSYSRLRNAVLFKISACQNIGKNSPSRTTRITPDQTAIPTLRCRIACLDCTSPFRQ